MQIRRPVTLLGLWVGIAGLGLQFVISMQAYLAAGRDIFGATGTFFSYYTILTNIILVLIYTAEVTDFAWLGIFRRPIWRAMMAAAMTLVMGFVYFVLSPLSTFSGLFLVCDIVLHYVTPVIYLCWWIFVPAHGALKWPDLPKMVVPTVIYFVYVMVRGALVHEYPYPVLAVTTLGYTQVLINAAYLALGLGVLCAIVIFYDRALARVATNRTSP